MFRERWSKANIFGRDFAAGFKGLVGGEIRGYTEMMNESRNVAIQRMIEEAQRLGADAVVNVKFGTSSIVQGAAEVLHTELP